MNQKLRNQLVAILEKLPMEDRRQLGKAIVNNLMDICGIENAPRNRRGKPQAPMTWDCCVQRCRGLN